MEKSFWILLPKTRLDAVKNASKKLVWKEAEAAGKFVGSKISDKIVKSKSVSDGNLRDAEEIIILPEKREEILNVFKSGNNECIKSGIIKSNTIKYQSY